MTPSRCRVISARTMPRPKLTAPLQLAAPVRGRSEWEVFYAYPTISAPAFFEALARVSEEQADAPALSSSSI